MNMNDASPYPRDFRGYGGNPPDPQWPGGAFERTLRTNSCAMAHTLGHFSLDLTSYLLYSPVQIKATPHPLTKKLKP